MVKLLMILVVTVTFLFAKDYTSDSLAVQEILDNNNVSSDIKYITTVRDGRVIELDISNLKKLEGIKKLEKLEILDGRDYFLIAEFKGDLPEELVELPNLKTILGIQLSSIPSVLHKLKRLEELHIHFTRAIPSELFSLSQIKKVTLGLQSGIRSTNDLTGISRLSNLEELNLFISDLPSLPTELSTLTKLKKLNVSYSSLTNLPSEIGNLTNLTHLTLKNLNNLVTLPSEIENLKSLTHLDIQTAPSLTTLPDEIGALTNLVDLKIHSAGLLNLPTTIGGLTKLEHLDILHSKLKTLPSEIGLLKSLKEINLRDNNLEEIPAEIGQLVNLTELVIPGNNILELPKEIGNLNNLKKLNCSSNNIAILPSTIGNLTKLEELYLSHNGLLYLPRTIGNLLELRGLHLRHNKLENLVTDLTNLRKVVRSSFTYNYLNPSKVTDPIKAWLTLYSPNWEEGQLFPTDISSYKKGIYDNKQLSAGILKGKLYYTLPHSGFTTVTLLNSRGVTLSQLVSSQQKHGVHFLNLQKSKISNGIYFLQIKHNKNSLIKKVRVN